MGSHACMQFSMLRVGLGAKDWTSDTTLEKIDFFGARAITSPSLPEEEFPKFTVSLHCLHYSTEAALSHTGAAWPSLTALAVPFRPVSSSNTRWWRKTWDHIDWKPLIERGTLISPGIKRKWYNPTLDLCFYYFSNSFLDLCFYCFSNSFSVACTVSHLNTLALKVLVTVNTDTKKKWIFVS